MKEGCLIPPPLPCSGLEIKEKEDGESNVSGNGNPLCLDVRYLYLQSA